MLPDDAVARIVEGAQSIGKICQSKGIGEWEVVAFQSYGHEFQSISNEIKIYLLRILLSFIALALQGGRFGYADYYRNQGPSMPFLKQFLSQRFHLQLKVFVFPKIKNLPMY